MNIEKYKEPKDTEIDWSKVKGDTPILVRNKDGDEWIKRYFAYCGDNCGRNGVYAWTDGRTSLTKPEKCDVFFWSEAKLAESKEERGNT